jgi:hypothetical protein
MTPVLKNISTKGPSNRNLSASLGMTNGRVAFPWRAVAEWKPFFITSGGQQAHDSYGRKHLCESPAEQQVPPLRYAPVGMTILFRFQNLALKTNLSSPGMTILGAIKNADSPASHGMIKEGSAVPLPADFSFA